ncbi:hypothetical protein TNCV_3314591 [Trichonephila clavipes]|nr:hypothetical protein TNCV_3314591 [Trichonephila clavipes]
MGVSHMQPPEMSPAATECTGELRFVLVYGMVVSTENCIERPAVRYGDLILGHIGHTRQERVKSVESQSFHTSCGEWGPCHWIDF